MNQNENFQNFEAFQDGSANQYKKILRLYMKNTTKDELEFMALNCAKMKGVFYSSKYNDLRVGKFEKQIPISFELFIQKLQNTFEK